MTTWTDSFESDFGNWSNESSADTGDWTRKTGSTGSANTGPSGASDGSYYLYVEASDGSFEAFLNFDQTLTDDARITFDYHMYGSDMGALCLEGYIDSEWVPFWAKWGDQGNQWNTVSQLTIPEGATKLRFRGGTTSSPQSDIAIDDITVEDGLSLDNSRFSSFGTTQTDDFESDFGNWTNDGLDRTSGGTPTSDTGPSSAYSNSYYVFWESSNTAYGDNGTITITNALNENGGHISFAEHRYGESIGILALEYSTDSKSTWNTLIAFAGNMGTAWRLVPFVEYPLGTTHLRFKLVSGANYYSDIAIDYVRLKEVSAGGGEVLTASPGSLSLSGLDATLLIDRIISASSGSYFKTGSDANLLKSYLITTELGSYLVNGADATLTYLQGLTLSASPGTYEITGIEASLLKDSFINGSPGNYNLTGSNASTIFDRLLSASPTSYALTVNNAGLLKDFSLVLEGGSYSINGFAATLTYNELGEIILSADPGSYSVNGSPASVLHNRILNGSSGSYTLTGTNAALLLSKALSASPGTYDVSGQDLTALLDRIISADTGSYSIIGEGIEVTVGIDATGRLTVTFSVKSPGASFSGKGPGTSFSGKGPGINFQ